MSNTTVRRVDGKDLDRIVPGIVRVFRDDEVVPWHRHDECLAFIRRSVTRGFYMVAAYDGDGITGYAEWIETHDCGRKLLYLGIMQVDCDLRGRGIGTAMLDDGHAYAKSIGAFWLRTIPEDERAHSFYRKYGFTDTDEIYCCTCPTTANATMVRGRQPAIMTVETANAHEFVFGLCQSSGRHMYEIANHNPACSDYAVTTAYHPDGHLQFRYRQGEKRALVLYWSDKRPDAATVLSIRECGNAAGLDEVEFYLRSEYQGLFACHDVTRESVEMEREV